MKLKEFLKEYNKEVVFDSYCRIVDKFKNYDNITRNKMLDAIYMTYSNYQNIIDICTERELIFLEKIIKNKEQINVDNYEWEIYNLRNKYLIFNYPTFQIPDEFYDNVCLALEHVDWNKIKENDRKNEILVGICKVYGEIDSNVLLTLGKCFLGISQDEVIEHLSSNKLFRYYVYFTVKELENIKREVGVFIYQDYFELIDELENERSKQGISYSEEFDIQDFINIFYYELNINRKNVNKFYIKAKELCNKYFSILINDIRIYSLLNFERESLKENLNLILKLKDDDFKKFSTLLDKAMDDMPSGALNGLTPNDLKFIRLENERNRYEKEVNYLPQKNANLSKKEAKLFYKLYFSLLEFVNNKYKVNYKLKKIYKKDRLNPFEISPIIDKFFENKDFIINEFIKNNPYHFNKEELDIVAGFKKGIRGLFVIANYELEYTLMLFEDKIYMVKGINGNIDEIIPYYNLPYIVKTTLLPFGDSIIYDGILQGIKDIDFGIGLERSVNRELKTNQKIYYL